MSTDFSEIQAAMSSIPDISIDPATGATMGSTGRTLGQKYKMEDKVSPKIAEKIRSNTKLSEATKEDSKSMVDAYKEMIGVPTSTQIKEHQQSILDAQQANKNSEMIMEQHYKGLVGDNSQPIQEKNYEGCQGVESLNEDVENPMMDMYVDSIQKKLKWSKK